MKPSFIFISFILLFLNSCSYFYKSDKNISKEGVLYIYPNSSYQQVLDSLQPYLKDKEKFDIVAKSLDYERFVKAGKYAILSDDTNESLVERLKNGKQEQVKLMVRNSPTIFHLAKDASKALYTDSTEIVEAILNHPKFQEEKLDLETSKIYFIPNTYFFNWITSGNEFVDRMIKEHDKFWNDKRKQELKASGMSELEVYTLASIVQMEASKADEQP